MSERLGVEVTEKQMVLSHTPLQAVVPEYANERVLVLGCREVPEVARAYGLTRACTVEDLARDDPRRYPFFHYPHEPHHDSGPIKAVMIMHGKCVRWPLACSGLTPFSP